MAPFLAQSKQTRKHSHERCMNVVYCADEEPEPEAAPSDVKPEPQEEQAQPKPDVKDEDGPKRPLAGNEHRSRREQIGTVVHVTDMSWYTTDIEVEAACGVYGTVKNVKFFEDRSNGRSMGACAVEFSSMDEAKACIAGLDGKTIGQETVLVDWPGKRPPFKQQRYETHVSLWEQHMNFSPTTQGHVDVTCSCAYGAVVT